MHTTSIGGGLCSLQWGSCCPWRFVPGSLYSSAPRWLSRGMARSGNVHALVRPKCRSILARFHKYRESVCLTGETVFSTLQRYKCLVMLKRLSTFIVRISLSAATTRPLYIYSGATGRCCSLLESSLSPTACCQMFFTMPPYAGCVEAVINSATSPASFTPTHSRAPPEK